MACAVRGARLAVSLSDPHSTWDAVSEVAQKVQDTILAAREALTPTMEGALIRARAAAGLPAACFLGRRHTSAHAACVAYAEHVLREFCRESDLSWQIGWEDDETGEWVEPAPGKWDVFHKDITAVDLEQLYWWIAREDVREHFRLLQLPDPEDIITEVRIETVFCHRPDDEQREDEKQAGEIPESEADRDNLDLIARALRLIANSDLGAEEIARGVGRSRAWLYRQPELKRALGLRRGSKDDIATGYKDAEGNLDAWQARRAE
jgi:hypothetical protein